MDAPVRKIYIDERIESYEGYVPDDWGAKAFEIAKSAPSLDRLLADLVLAWRTTAYIASMPATFIKGIQASTLGYAKFVSPDSSIVSFAENIIAKVSRKVPQLVDDRHLRSRLIAELATTADEFRNARAAVTPEMPIEPIWKDFLKQDAFYMSIWASQRVAYVSFYNAYEAFLVQCTKQALGLDRLRPTDKEFNQAVRTAFGNDTFDRCWTHHEINKARVVRHALSHAGGLETDDLKKHKHGIKLVDDVLQIVPGDNHAMLKRLRCAVDALVTAAVGHPRFM
jgi:hypothetical protein